MEFLVENSIYKKYEREENGESPVWWGIGIGVVKRNAEDESELATSRMPD